MLSTNWRTSDPKRLRLSEGVRRSPAQRQPRHEVLFDTVWLDWNPDQALRVAAGILQKQASGRAGCGVGTTAARGLKPFGPWSKPGRLKPVLRGPAWTNLTGLLLTNSNYLYLDTTSSNVSFYRAVGTP